MKVTFTCSFLSRVLIALLFIVAGFGKLMGAFHPMNAMGQEVSLGVFARDMMTPIPMIGSSTTLATLALIIVIAVELVGGILFAIGWKVRMMGWALAVFTALTVIFYHNPFAGEVFNQAQMIQALKNISIIGGIMAAIACFCGKCQVKK